MANVVKMKLPHENKIRQTWLSVSGRSLSLPCFFPSISSVKPNLEPIEYLRMLVGIHFPQFLISAFDIFYIAEDQRQQLRALLQRALEHEQLILLDSGNYESYWRENNSWNKDAFHSVLQTEPYHLAFCLDKQEDYEDTSLIANQVEASVISSQTEAQEATVIPIVHGSPDTLPESSVQITQRLHPLLLAIPERELGSGIIERSTTLLRIRKKLDETGQYYPLHLLGTGNPLSILIYSICGADSFDGLEWCQTTVDHATGLLYHFQQREFFEVKTPFDLMPELPYEHATLAHNLMFYRTWMDDIQYSINDGSIIDKATKFLGQPFCDSLLTQLSGVS